MSDRRGVCVVLTAPSGAGKSTIARQLLATEPDLALSVSVTTRAPRAGEQDGVNYFFRSRAAFEAMIAAGELLEWADVFGQLYGTPRAPVIAALEAGRDVVFGGGIDWQGHRNLRAALPGDVVGVFILPPSLPELGQRLRARGDSAEEIARRIASPAARAEIAHWTEFGHVVVNRTLDQAVADVRSILHAARLATARQSEIAALVAELSRESA